MGRGYVRWGNACRAVPPLAAGRMPFVHCTNFRPSVETAEDLGWFLPGEVPPFVEQEKSYLKWGASPKRGKAQNASGSSGPGATG